MKSKAPARSGNLLCRLAPRHSTALLALPLAVLLAGCATGTADSDSAASGASAPVARQERATGGPDAAPSGPEAPRAGSAGDPHQADDAGPIPEVELSSQLMFQLLASEIAAQRGELASATTSYLSMARQTRDPRLARRATLGIGRSGTIGRHSSGDIFLADQEVSRLSEEDLGPVRKKCAMVFQNSTLFDSMTCADNAALPLRKHRGMRFSEALADAKRRLKQMQKGFDSQASL